MVSGLGFSTPVSGSVLDFYEIYSVHQYGMAPAFLERAECHGVTDARARNRQRLQLGFWQESTGNPDVSSRFAPDHSLPSAQRANCTPKLEEPFAPLAIRS